MSTSLAAFAARYWGGELHAAGRLLDVALAPAEALFRAGVALRARGYERHAFAAVSAPVPVISVGNIAVGGAGKTPFTQFLAQRLRARGGRPAIVHGGYAADEPELHRRWGPDIPVVVGRDRVQAARTAAAQGAGVVLLDDGFQHRRLRRDLDIVLVAAEHFGRRPHMLPRGPWREPFAALRRADLIVTTRKSPDTAVTPPLAAALARAGRPVVNVYLRPDAWLQAGACTSAPTEPALAVSAIADPASFAAAAQAAGARLAQQMNFPDHHDYTEADAAAIAQRAAGRPIVTTEKDWTKLDAWLDSVQVRVLTQRVVVEAGAELLEAALERVVA